MAKQITLGEQSRAAILRGVNKLADTGRITLGPGPSCQSVGQIQAVGCRGTFRRPQSAASIGGLMLTTEVLVSEFQDDNKPGEAFGGKGAR